MSNQVWIAILVVIVVVAVLAGFFLARLFRSTEKTIGAAAAVAGDGINAMAGIGNEAIATLKPLTESTAQVITGVGDVTKGAGAIVNSFAERLKNKQKERVQLAAENAALLAQVEQLKGRQVNAGAIERQLQVAFFSIEGQFTSFKQEVNGTAAGGMLGLERSTSREYVGVVDATYVMKIGVDLKKLEFELKKGSNVVYVHGAHEAENIGLTGLKLDERFAEARTLFHKTALRASTVEVLAIDDEFIGDGRKHRDEVLNQIQNSQLASSLAEANEKIAMGFFNALMGGGRYEFIAKREPMDERLSFEQLCEAINGDLSRQIEELEENRNSAASRAELLDAEILEMAVLSHRESAPVAGSIG